MIPVQFKESNTVVGEMPAYVDGEITVTKWAMTVEELHAVMMNRSIYLVCIGTSSIALVVGDSTANAVANIIEGVRKDEGEVSSN